MNNPDLFDTEKAQLVHLSHVSSASCPELGSFPASFVKPCAYWSSVEKASFFASLARHSRWQPGRIAEDIGGGKTVADVCSYIELLEQGSARKVRRRKRRNAHPTAHEVSAEWIAMENNIAVELCAKDGVQQKAALKRKRRHELRMVRKALHGSRETTGKSVSESEDADTTRSHKRARHALDQAESEALEERWNARRQALYTFWKREDFLSSLDRRLLKVMDQMILKTLEESEADNTMKGDQLDLEIARGGQGGDAQLNMSYLDAPSSGGRTHGTSNPDMIDSQIDPTHLAPDTGTVNRKILSRFHSSSKTNNVPGSSSSALQSTLPAPSQVSAPGPSRIHDSTFLSLNTTSPPVNQYTSLSQPSDAKLSPTSSPASRRRLRKRLWARHRRAREKGLPTSEVSNDTVKLKRGPKAKAKAHERGLRAKANISETQADVNQLGTTIRRSSPEILDDHVNESEDEDEIFDDSQPTPTRKPYRWAKLTARQVSGVTLRSDGMDLFHLGKIWDLMSFLGRVNLLPVEADPISQVGASGEGPSSVSYHFIQFLRACLIRFVTRLVAFVILHKGVETRQKRRIRKIFQSGGAEKIRSKNVRAALLHMGRDKSTNPFFMRLKRTVKAIITHAPSASRLNSDPNADESDEMVSSDDGSSKETEDDDTSSMGSLSTQFRRASQRVFSPPCDDPQGPLSWNPSILSAPDGMSHCSLLPEAMDDSRVQKELEAEEQVEKADYEADQMYERDLWMDIGIERVEPMKQESSNRTTFESQEPESLELPHLATIETEALHSLRFRQPGGIIKSMVYIDSDEDF